MSEKTKAGTKKKKAKQKPEQVETVEQPQLDLFNTLEAAPDSKAPSALKSGSIKTIAGKRVGQFDATRLVLPEHWNPRRDYGNMSELKSSILQHGLQEMIRVRQNTAGVWMVTAGFRRVTACKEIASENNAPFYMPAVIEEKETDLSAVMTNNILQNAGKKFTPLEAADGFARLKQLGMTEKEIAAHFGIAQATVTRRIRLYRDAGDALRSAVHEEAITLGQADSILKQAKADHAKQEELLKKLQIRMQKLYDLQQQTGGDKDDPAAADEKPAKKKTKVGAAQARKLLAEIGTLYVSLLRGRRALNANNQDWIKLEKKLAEVKRLKRLGLIKE